jgi:predicted amidohydrolase
MKVGLAQVGDKGSFSKNIEQCLDYITLSKKIGVDILCFPEMQFSYFFPQDRNDREPFQWAEGIPGATVELFQEKAKETGITVVLNMIECFNYEFFNSSPVIDSNGRLLGVSRMVHIPQVDGYYGQSYFTPSCGDFRTYRTRRGRVGILISYDRHFPEASRALALHDAEIVLIPGFLTKDQDKSVYRAELQAMAYQNSLFVGMCNRVGVERNQRFEGKSLLVNPKGEILAEGSCEEEIVVVEIDLEEVKRERRINPYLKLRRPDEYLNIIRQN